MLAHSLGGVLRFICGARFEEQRVYEETAVRIQDGVESTGRFEHLGRDPEMFGKAYGVPNLGHLAALSTHNVLPFSDERPTDG